MAIKKREVNQMRKDMLEDGLKSSQAKRIAIKKTNTDMKTGANKTKKKKPTLRKMKVAGKK